MEKVLIQAGGVYQHLLEAEYQHKLFFLGLSEYTPSGTLSLQESKPCLSHY